MNRGECLFPLRGNLQLDEPGTSQNHWLSLVPQQQPTTPHAVLYAPV